MAGFSALINKNNTPGVWKGIQMDASASDITHMMFVDDVMLFVEASIPNIQNVLTIIELLCEGSGQRINVDKSIAFIAPGTSR